MLVAATLCAVVAIGSSRFIGHQEQVTGRSDPIVDGRSGHVTRDSLSALLSEPISNEHLTLFTRQLTNLATEGRIPELQDAIVTTERLQPKSPRIWNTMSYVLMFNVSYVHHEDPEWRWRWIRSGLVEAKHGFDQTEVPLDVGIELAFNLDLLMEAPGPGIFDLDVISRFKSDDELQRLITPPGQPGTISAKHSPFTMAILWRTWIKGILTNVHGLPFQSEYVTRSGVKASPEVQDGFIKHHSYCEAMYQWREGKFDDALRWLRLAVAKCDEILRNDPSVSPMFVKWRDFYREMQEVIQLDKGAVGIGIDTEDGRRMYTKAIVRAEAALSPAKDEKARSELDNGYVQAFIARAKAKSK